MRIFLAGLMLCLSVAVLWGCMFTLPATPLSAEVFLAEYQTSVDAGETKSLDALKLEMVEDGRARFQFSALDGDLVHGYIEWPKQQRPDAGFPVLLGLSAMGQSAQRWWQAEYKGRPTITQTHRIRDMAINAGYVLVTIENRFTDSRKNPERSIDGIMTDLHIFGDKTDYEKMVHGTVMDARLLLDKLALQPELNLQRVTVLGYSMGAQMGFLLSAVDPRIHRLVAVVPPWLSDKTARVAPKNAAPLIKDIPVLLITADDDEYASIEQNARLFAAIASPQKQHIRFDAGHLLPATYVDALRPAFNVVN